MINYIKEHKKTVFLKIALVFVFIPIGMITVFSAPSMYREAIENNEINQYFVLPFVVLMMLVLLTSAFAIIQTMKLLTNIERGKYYSEESLRSFRLIQYCGVVTTILFVAMLPSIYYFAEMDDAPGIILLGLAFVCASIGIAVFASVMSDLVVEKVSGRDSF